MIRQYYLITLILTFAHFGYAGNQQESEADDFEIIEFKNSSAFCAFIEQSTTSYLGYDDVYLYGTVRNIPIFPDTKSRVVAVIMLKKESADLNELKHSIELSNRLKEMNDHVRALAAQRLDQTTPGWNDTPEGFYDVFVVPQLGWRYDNDAFLDWYIKTGKKLNRGLPNQN